MDAKVSDRLVIHGARVGQPDRVGEIIEVVPSHGAARYRVKWSDGHESIYSPGPGAEIDSEARERAEWKARVDARRAFSAARRRGITAGVGREASLAQEKLERPAPDAGGDSEVADAGGDAAGDEGDVAEGDVAGAEGDAAAASG